MNEIFFVPFFQIVIQFCWLLTGLACHLISNTIAMERLYTQKEYNMYKKSEILHSCNQNTKRRHVTTDIDRVS